MKRLLAITLALLFSTSAFAQIGGNDWTPLYSGTFTITHDDGTKIEYRVNYSPSSITRDAVSVSVIYDAVFVDNRPTNFVRDRFYCGAQKYTYTVFDVSTTPPTEGPVSESKDIQPDSVGSMLAAVVCGGQK